jgi:hypothetical protein
MSRKQQEAVWESRKKGCRKRQQEIIRGSWR